MTAKFLLLSDVAALYKIYLLVENLKWFSSRVERSKVFPSASRALSFCLTDITYKMVYVDLSQKWKRKNDRWRNYISYGKHTVSIQYVETFLYYFSLKKRSVERNFTPGFDLV